MDKINKINKITFKTKNTFEDRRNEADKINTKYPLRVPIIVEKCDKSTLVDIDKNKFLVPSCIIFVVMDTTASVSL